MKVVLVLAVVLAVALAEPCRQTKDCYQHGITTCGNGYHVACNSNQCECTNGPIAGSTCTVKADCSCTDSRQNAHCIDSHCHCTRF